MGVQLGITCAGEPQQGFEGCLNGAWSPPRTIPSVTSNRAKVSSITVGVSHSYRPSLKPD